MRYLVFLLLSFWSCSLLAADVTVKISGLNSEKGQLLVAIYADGGGFLDPKSAVKQSIVKVHDGKDGFHVNDLGPGPYAIAVIHDQNNNGRLDTNFIGIPKEPFGTSNNVVSKFGPPSFERAKFWMKDGLELKIDLKTY